MESEVIDIPEYLQFRCCLCPNRNQQTDKCLPKPFNPEVTECRFVKTYIDSRGWRYRVIAGLGDSNFKARYNKPGKSGWKCMANLPWRKSFDEGQADLNAIAGKKEWAED